MQTLNKQITSEFFLDPSTGWTNLKKRWAELVNDPNFHLTSGDHLAYLILRGRDWRKGFTQPKKLDPSWEHKISPNTWNSFTWASYHGRLMKLFPDLLVPDIDRKLKSLIPTLKELDEGVTYKDLSPYMYVFVNSNLEPTLKAVQAAHAAHMAGEKFGAPNNCHLILLECKNVQELDVNPNEIVFHYDPDEKSGGPGVLSAATKPVFFTKRRTEKLVHI